MMHWKTLLEDTERGGDVVLRHGRNDSQKPPRLVRPPRPVVHAKTSTGRPSARVLCRALTAQYAADDGSLWESSEAERYGAPLSAAELLRTNDPLSHGLVDPLAATRRRAELAHKVLSRPRWWESRGNTRCRQHRARFPTSVSMTLTIPAREQPERSAHPHRASVAFVAEGVCRKAEEAVCRGTAQTFAGRRRPSLRRGPRAHGQPHTIIARRAAVAGWNWLSTSAGCLPAPILAVESFAVADPSLRRGVQ
jgi:hypothetical protein